MPREKMIVTIKRICFFILALLIWDLLVRFNLWKAMPAPLQVWDVLLIRIQDHTLLYDIQASFKHLLIGLSISLCIGTALGILLARSRTADDTIGMVILAMQSVPSIVWLPLAIMWFGLNESAVIFIVILGGTFVMTINMRIGIKSVSPIYLKAARTMGSSGIDLFYRVVIPASIPYAVTGVRLAWAFAWRALMAGELLSPGPGLGYTLKYASDFGDMPLVIAVMFVIGIVGIIVDQFIFTRLERKVMNRWGLDQPAG